MPLQLLRPLLLPLAILLGANLLAFAWRAIEPSSQERSSDSSWQSLQAAQAQPDVRAVLLAGKHWGEPQSVAERGVETQSVTDTPDNSVSALSQHIQRQLQGIIRRGDWVLLFANPASSTNAEPAPQKTTKGQPASQPEPAPALAPLELRSGDQLPDTPWHIGDIWPDRIQLLQSGHEPLIVPLYPLATPSPEL